jgi:hypothetical protein
VFRGLFFRALERTGGLEDKFKFPFKRLVAKSLVQGFVTDDFVAFGASAPE